MSRMLPKLWCIIASVLFAGALFAQEKPDDPRWNIPLTRPMKSAQPATATRPDPNFVQNTTTRVVVTPQEVLLVEPNIQPRGGTGREQAEVDFKAQASNRNIMFGASHNFSGGNINVATFITTNGGVTWYGGDTLADLNTQRGDPAPIIDASGVFLYGHLLSSTNFGGVTGMAFNYSTNKGLTWSPSISIPNAGGSDVDKNLVGTDEDPSSPYYGYTYMAWCKFTGGSFPAVILISRTTDHGVTWSSATTINTAGASTFSQGTDVAVARNGTVYVCWTEESRTSPYPSQSIGFGKSTDAGTTWTFTNNAFATSGIRDNSNFNNWSVRVNDFPRMAIDKTGGGRDGWLYIVQPQKNLAPAGTESDIVLHRSTDGGATWSSGIRVNQDPLSNGKVQFFPAICVDQGGGINVVYYDNRNYPSVGDSCEEYVSRSLDGGTTWTDIKVSDHSWKPKPAPGVTSFMGDYIGIAAGNGKVWPMWQDDRPGHYTVWTTGVQTTEGFGWVKGIVTNVSGGAPLANVNIDFTNPFPQAPGLTDPTGFYKTGVKVDTPGTTANVTLRARKFGFRDTLINLTVTRNDTLTRNFAMTSVSNGTLIVRTVRRDSSNIRSGITVLFNGTTVASGNTDSLTGIFTTILPLGSYDVLVDPPSPYGNRRFNGVVIASGSNPLYVVVRAVVENSPAAMRDTLAVGQVHAKTLVLTNTTGDTVPYRLSDDNALARMRFSKPAVQPRTIDIPGIVRPKGSPDPGPARIDSSGGPDAFGYRFVDSDSPGGPIFNWFNIDTAGRGTAITFSNNDDGNTAVPLTIPFPFYGNTYSSTVNVCTNGWMSFTSTTTEYSSTPIPNSATPNNAIYPFWDDLNVTSGNVKYYYDAPNTRFIVQWTNVPPFSGTGSGTWQVILYPSGQIIIQYLSVTYSSPAATVGIENADGTVALQVSYNGTYVHNNLAVKYYLPDVPWLSESPTFGRLNPNSTQNTTVTFDATGLLSGTTYNAKILLDLTHPDVTGSILIPASLKVNVASNPVIILSKTSIAFPPTEIGTTWRDSLAVRNGGSPSLIVSSISSTNPRFVPTPTSATIVPGDSIRLRVTYTAVAPAHSDTGRVIILSNDPLVPRIDVMLSGSSLGVAHVAVRPDTFFFSRGATPDTTFSSFKVYSTGTDTLRYTINETTNFSLQEGRAIERSRSQQQVLSLSKGAIDPRPGEGGTDSHGGPDAFGYRWIDSDEPGGPLFNWIDIKTVGTQVTTWTSGTGDDGYYTLTFPAGFSFPFYGTTYTSASMGSNGNVQFGPTYSTQYINDNIPTTAVPNNAIYPYWDDLNFNEAGGSPWYYYDAANSQFIFQWDSVSHYVGTGDSGRYSFQAILKSNGQIITQYKRMTGDLASETIGLENTGGTVALPVVFSASYVHDNLAILFTTDIITWMSTGRSSGTVAPGDSQAVSLRVHPLGLSPGLYTGFQKVRGNTPDTTANVRVRLNVVSVEAVVTVTSPNGGEIWNAGSIHPITWTKIGALDTVRIDYSTNGPGGPWNQITGGTPARPGIHQTRIASPDNPNGTYNWTIPTGISSTNSYIRVAWKSNPAVFDLNDAAFTIQPGGPGDTTIVVFHDVGWNLVSNPVTNPIPDDSARHLWRTIIGRAFGFSSGYVATDTIQNGVGYWAKFPAAGTDTITGTLRVRDSISVQAGWNIIGSISRPVDTSNIVSVPPGLRSSTWFGYSGGYGVISQIIPGKGYWVKSNGVGKFVLANPVLSGSAKVSTYGMGLDMLNSLTLKDSKGMSQTLYFGPDPNGEVPAELFSMPPAPPAGAFDVRFQGSDGGSMVRTYTGKASEEFPVAIQSDAYPLTVIWKIKGGTASYELTDGLGGRLFHPRQMMGEGSMSINSSAVGRISVRWLADSGIPMEYALSQNYPNPFNPTTRIKYQLPRAGLVTLKVFDILGRDVATLINTVEDAGYKSVVFDATTLASGVYFYRIQAGSFSQTMKMMLVK